MTYDVILFAIWFACLVWYQWKYILLPLNCCIKHKCHLIIFFFYVMKFQLVVCMQAAHMRQFILCLQFYNLHTYIPTLHNKNQFHVVKKSLFLNYSSYISRYLDNFIINFRALTWNQIYCKFSINQWNVTTKHASWANWVNKKISKLWLQFNSL